jgi:hypothetical protein
MTMEADLERACRAARRAYELGRLRLGSVRALGVAATAATVAAIVVGRRALIWMPVTFALWVLVEWRGAWLSKGARRGLLAGAFTLLLPLSLLRPCCDMTAMHAGEGCGGGMSNACLAVGSIFGLSLALLLPRAPRERRAEAALGTALGAASLAVFRCAPLLLGEAIGLLVGLVAGVAAAGLAHLWMGRRAAA